MSPSALLPNLAEQNIPFTNFAKVANEQQWRRFEVLVPLQFNDGRAMAKMDVEQLFWNALGYLILIAIILAIVLIVRAFLRKPEEKFRRVYADVPFQTTATPDKVFFEFHTYDGFLIWFTQTTHAGYAIPQHARELLRRLHRYNLTYGLFAAGALFVPFLSYFNYRAQLRSLKDQESKIGLVSRFHGHSDDMQRGVGDSSAITAGNGLASVATADTGAILERSSTASDNPALGAAKEVPAASPRLPLAAVVSRNVSANALSFAKSKKSGIRTFMGWVTAGLCVLFAITSLIGLFQGRFEVAIGGVILIIFLGNIARDWIRGKPL